MSAGKACNCCIWHGDGRCACHGVPVSGRRVTASRKTYDEPHDRLTRLAKVMLEAMAASPLYREDDRVVVLLTNGPDENRKGEGGQGVHGYESAADAVSDVMLHADAMLKEGL